MQLYQHQELLNKSSLTCSSIALPQGLTFHRLDATIDRAPRLPIDIHRCKQVPETWVKVWMLAHCNLNERGSSCASLLRAECIDVLKCLFFVLLTLLPSCVGGLKSNDHIRQEAVETFKPAMRINPSANRRTGRPLLPVALESLPGRELRTVNAMSTYSASFQLGRKP